jgi:hypothetical protein
LVRAGIAILYLSTFIGFILFAIAIAVAYSGPKVVGIVGVTLFAVTVGGLVVFGVSTKGPPPENSIAGVLEQPLQDEKVKVKDIGIPKVVILLIIFVVQLICLGLLLGVGGHAVVTGQLGSECKGVEEEVFNSGNPIPVAVVSVAAGANGYVTVTRGYTATITVTEMITDVVSGTSSDGDDGVATVVDWTSITVMATVTAGL